MPRLKKNTVFKDKASFICGDADIAFPFIAMLCTYTDTVRPRGHGTAGVSPASYAATEKKHRFKDKASFICGDAEIAFSFIAVLCTYTGTVRPRGHGTAGVSPASYAATEKKHCF